MNEPQEYNSRQAQRDREYERAFQSPEVQKWIDSLSREERHRLEAEGLLAPMIERGGRTMRDEDLASTSLASERTDIAAELDQPVQPAVVDSAQASADALASFCARIRSVSNPLLVFDAVCYATGVLALDGVSQTELAKRHGVSRAAFSKIATQWCKTFGLKPSRGMKSERAREVYAQLTRERWNDRNYRPSRS